MQAGANQGATRLRFLLGAAHDDVLARLGVGVDLQLKGEGSVSTQAQDNALRPPRASVLQQGVRMLKAQILVVWYLPTQRFSALKRTPIEAKHSQREFVSLPARRSSAVRACSHAFRNQVAASGAPDVEGHLKAARRKRG